MLTKVIGAALLVGGVVLAFPLLSGLVTGTWAALILMVKWALVGGLAYWGWRWINSETTLAKVLGAFLLVGGAVMSFSLVGGIIVGVFGALIFLLKAALVGGLIYWGWCWVNGRPFSRPRLRKF